MSDNEIQLPEQAVADYIGSLEQQLADLKEQLANKIEGMLHLEQDLADALRRVVQALRDIRQVASENYEYAKFYRMADAALAALDAAVPASQPVQDLP